MQSERARLQDLGVISKEALEALKEFNLPTFETELHSLVAYKYAISEGKGVSEYELNGKASKEMQLLWGEILKWL